MNSFTISSVDNKMTSLSQHRTLALEENVFILFILVLENGAVS